jgi:hypothetical protein
MNGPSIFRENMAQSRVMVAQVDRDGHARSSPVGQAQWLARA